MEISYILYNFDLLDCDDYSNNKDKLRTLFEWTFNNLII